MNRITSEITYGKNVDRQTMDERQRKAHPWTVTLRYQRRQFTFPFYTGSALGEPTTFDAANCILSDARGFAYSQGFEGWALDHGFDPDSRKAEQIYNRCGEIFQRTLKLLGADWEDFIDMDEDSLERRCK